MIRSRKSLERILGVINAVLIGGMSLLVYIPVFKVVFSHLWVNTAVTLRLK